MSPEVVSVAVLVLLFVLATTMPVNLGALSFVAAFLVGTLVVGLTVDEIILGVPGDGEITGGFPGDLFVLLVGLTYLFALAQPTARSTWWWRGRCGWSAAGSRPCRGWSSR